MFGAVLSFGESLLQGKDLNTLAADEKSFLAVGDLAGFVPDIMKMLVTCRSIKTPGKALTDQQLDAVENICSVVSSSKVLLDGYMSEMGKALVSGRDVANDSLGEIVEAYKALLSKEPRPQIFHTISV